MRDGKILSNQKLFDGLKVPEKTQRRFTIARDYHEQTKSSERLTARYRQKDPFYVPANIVPDQPNKRNQAQTQRDSIIRKGKNMMGSKMDVDQEDEKLNNVKVTDIRDKEMLLLAGSIFDIKPSEEMNQSKTSGFNVNIKHGGRPLATNRSRGIKHEVSQSV